MEEVARSVVCRLEDVPDGDARGFELDDGHDGEEGRPLRLIVVRQGEHALVYVNRCPHRGTPLDWMPDRFLDAEGRHLICATHGALFRVEDGLCMAGPCAGDALVRVAAWVVDGEVRLDGP